MSQANTILLDGLTADEVLALSLEELRALLFVGEPVLLHAGSAEVLGQFELVDDHLTIELAQIDGGGEGVLRTLWLVARRFADIHNLTRIEWVVHAVNCAEPNLKLRRVLSLRGFEVVEHPEHGDVYHLVDDLRSRSTVGPSGG